MVGIVCTAFAIIGIAVWLAGRVVSDRYEWSQWLLWIPTPAVLLAALVGALGAIRPAREPRQRRRRLLRWAVAFVALGVYFSVFEHRLARRTTNAAGTHLVHCSIESVEAETLTAYGDRLAELAADVTLISGLIPPRALYDLSTRLKSDVGPAVMIWPFTLITRLPVLEARLLVIKSDIHIVMFQVDAGEQLGRPLTIYAIDLPSDPKLPRSEIAADVRRLLDSATAPPPDLVVGDFNMTHGSVSMASLFPDLEHAYRQAGRGYGATFPREWPLYHIDHILVADTVKATDYTLIDLGVGRHRAQSAHVSAWE